ncbi:hypothetical protein JR316_0006908 [Psilocybe cubensis]|uniref:Uncharacterized protein n=2 Tax=Psilocybe cubensis TaxID=181762 RepID=A0ACB8GX41_PSICU|nr:hypothetical protein JR316_0006908 [Psilocybe cubensis]KAH9480310.1 hypothetical protein JR316_0006908 [Psilocybe cubensis]
MAEHLDYQQRSRVPSSARPHEGLPGSFPRTNRYSHHSVAPSTRNWVTSTQQNPPGPPPPQPINVPSPVHVPRPLPIPRGQGPLHVVNNPEPKKMDDSKRPIGDAQPPLFTQQPTTFDPSFGALRPRKRKTFVGGFVRRIRKLPKTVFGYGAGSGKPDLGNTGPHATSDTGTVSSITGMSTGNTLPLYTSNPTTPVVPGQVPSNLTGYRRPQPHMMTSEPTIPESPLPSVVRLDDNRRPNPTFRISPPSAEVEPPQNARLFAADGEPFLDHSVSDGPPTNSADRTTFLVYNEPETQYHSRNSHAPGLTPPPVARQISSPGLSYVSSEPLAPIRPTSFHSTHAHVPPAIETHQTTSTSAPAPAPRTSYSSQAPTPRVTPPSLIPGAVNSSSGNVVQDHLLDLQPKSQPIEPTQVTAEAIQSPVSVHPNPAADYLKMSLSPEPTSNGTLTSGTSYYDPSFSSDLNPVERFFKGLYNMPWISHNRVTVDYFPGEGLGKMKKKKFRPATSWYQSILSRSRRSSASLDLLSSGMNSEASPRHSLATGVALALGSPLSGSRRSKTASDRNRSTHRSRHQSSSGRRDRRHHRHHHTNNGEKKRRHTATTMDSTDTGVNPKYAGIKGTSPLIPSAYPFQYPPYPYPAFPTFPMPLTLPASAPGVLSGHDPNQPPQMALRPEDRPTVPRGPRVEQQPLLYAPAGYALNSYQPVMPPPQFYVLSSPPQANASNLFHNAATVSNNNGNSSAGATALASQEPQQTSTHTGVMFMQTIPGSFS